MEQLFNDMTSTLLSIVTILALIAIGVFVIMIIFGLVSFIYLFIKSYIDYLQKRL